VYSAAVFSPALLLFAQAGLVAVVPDSGPGCPSARDVEEALYARVPAAVIPYSEAKRRDALQLALTAPAPDGHRTFTLADNTGQARLQRTLPPGGPTDCAALAETAALIVQRFLTEIEEPVVETAPLPAPRPSLESPPPGPERRWDLSVASGWRVGSQVRGALAVGARVGRLLGPSGRLVVAGGAGLGGLAALTPIGMDYDGAARARQFPIDLGLWWRTVGSRAEVQVGAGGGLDLSWVETRSASGLRETRLLPGPVFFAASALRLALRGPTFFRLSAAAAGSVVTYRFSQRAETSTDTLPIFSVPTRRFYVRIAADIGFSLQ
jgi:hypothetical protein